MRIPLQLSFLHMEASSALEKIVEQQAASLDKYAEHISSCHITLGAPLKQNSLRKRFYIRIGITLHETEIIVEQSSGHDPTHESLRLALCDAFNTMKHHLDEYLRQQQVKLKNAEPSKHGIIKQLFPYQDYGVIETAEGRDVIFYRHSTLEVDFDRLSEGDHVNFTEISDDRPRQATRIHILGKHYVIKP